MADNSDSDLDRDWESLKLCFEFFKHSTTLTTAVGIIFLAVLRDFDFHTRAAVFGLSTLAGALFLSLIGLLVLLVKAIDSSPLGVRPGYPTFLLAAFVMSLFCTGVVAFVGFAEGPVSGPLFPF